MVVGTLKKKVKQLTDATEIGNNLGGGVYKKSREHRLSALREIWPTCQHWAEAQGSLDVAVQHATCKPLQSHRFISTAWPSAGRRVFWRCRLADVEGARRQPINRPAFLAISQTVASKVAGIWKETTICRHLSLTAPVHDL
jgi:hypothetical protein